MLVVNKMKDTLISSDTLAGAWCVYTLGYKILEGGYKLIYQLSGIH